MRWKGVVRMTVLYRLAFVVGVVVLGGQHTVAQTPSLSGSNIWTGPHNNIPETTLTDGSSIVPPSSSGSYLLTVSGAGHVIKCPSSIAVVDYVKFGITEGASPVSFDGACYGWIGGVQPTLTANGYDEVYCGSRTTTAGNTAQFTCNALLNVKAPTPPPPPVSVTWNPNDKGSGIALSNNNLRADFSNNTYSSVRSTNMPARTTGKLHAEFTMTTMTNGIPAIGLADGNATLTSYCGNDTHAIIADPVAVGVNKLQIFQNSAQINAYPLTPVKGDVIAIEVDIPSSLVWWNDVTQGTGWTNASNNTFTGNPAAGTGGTRFTLSASSGVMLCGSGEIDGAGTHQIIDLNAGPTFAGAVSSGFLPWNHP